jgi:hypothetical protein
MKSTLRTTDKLVMSEPMEECFADVVEEAWLLSQTFKILVEFNFKSVLFAISPEMTYSEALATSKGIFE